MSPKESSARPSDGVLCREPTSLMRVRDLEAVRGKTRDGVRSPDPDRILYSAYRDWLSPASSMWPSEGVWRADLVRYEGGMLEEGEPCRSMGHWNPVDQFEAFEVLSGEVVMLVMTPKGDLECFRAKPMTTWTIPSGAYHLTYAPEAAEVLNIYNAGHSQNDPGKYSRGTAPDLALRLLAGELAVVSQAADSFFGRLETFPPRNCMCDHRPLIQLLSAGDRALKAAFGCL